MDAVEAVAGEVRIELLGRFRVLVGECEIAEADWPSRRARELVELLALANDHRLARDRVIEWLWPHLDARAGAANLRKAAHHVRRALGDPGAVVLRAERVELFPARAVDVDVARFLGDAERVLREADPEACALVATGYGGELLPDCPYETWVQEPRRQVHAGLCELLRCGGQWERLLEVDPTDEAASRELMREAIEAGRRHVAIRASERLRIAMVRELGAGPGVETRVLYDRCAAGIRLGEAVFVGREVELAEAAGVLRSAAEGRTSALLVRGPSGIGKSAFCHQVSARARADGWRVISVAAGSASEPYGALGAILEQLLASGHGALDVLPPRGRSIVAELTPLAPAAPALEGALTRHQVVATVQRALAVTAAGAPTMLCVEDAHLLDEATADSLHLLVAGGAGPLLVALAWRSEWIRTSLPHGIVELARDDSALVVELGPLPEDEIAQLVKLAAPMPPTDEAIERIVELAQGSPFFALELARETTADSAGLLPGTVRQAVLRRLAGLDGTEIDALAALAIVGDELDLASVVALTGMSEIDVFGCWTPCWTPGSWWCPALASTQVPHRSWSPSTGSGASVPARRCSGCCAQLGAPSASAHLLTHWARSSGCWPRRRHTRMRWSCAPRSWTRWATVARLRPTRRRPRRSVSPKRRNCAPARRSRS
jgi:DNA-binding SARP family transcriptional activator